MQAVSEKGSIYLLIGYLGSGKTTFIKNLLNNEHGGKYAVIQNQFAQGQMGMEQPLIVNQSGVPFSNFLELPNGCICCSAKNDLMAGIEYILNNTTVRHIVVETNGVADPAESIKQFWFDEEMKINGELHSVLSIFSVAKWKDRKNQDLFQKQLIFCNKALLTFVDKSSEEDVKELEQYIQQKNPSCLVKRNTDYQIESFLKESTIFEVKSLANLQQGSPVSHSHLNSLFFCGEIKALSKQEFEHCVGQLLWESGYKVWRIKGVASIVDSETVYELQGVEDLFEIKETKTSKEKFSNKTKILVIGEELNREKIQEILKIL